MIILKTFITGFAILNVAGTIYYLCRGSQRSYKETASSWLQKAPYWINFWFAALITMAWAQLGVIALPFWGEWVLGGMGAVIFTSGLAFGRASAKSLGPQGTPDIAVMQDHQLITSGPYALCRHPVYLAIIMTWLGASFVFASYFLFLGFMGVSIVETLRAFEEEKLLRSHFGKDFEEYARRVPAILPSFMGRCGIQ